MQLGAGGRGSFVVRETQIAWRSPLPAAYSAGSPSSRLLQSRQRNARVSRLAALGARAHSSTHTRTSTSTSTSTRSAPPFTHTNTPARHTPDTRPTHAQHTSRPYCATCHVPSLDSPTALVCVREGVCVVSLCSLTRSVFVYAGM